ncbi:unnamed protein product [Cylicocyclus nassatus]|uniref:Uncharacterized protein n=1 Tax=Cylicocyclus nassatus TaxID=53992 RepID=A0AA36H849_CYLNA|nr:unnamed protein product [Cylicocyclus nassatus]
MIQSRLCTPEGYMIGSLRGGRFIIGNNGDIFGVRYQKCDDSDSNDALTHADSNKKFLLEVQWTAERDIGAVQFMLTVAAEDELYWERWRPRNGFIRPETGKDGHVVESLFEIEVSPGPEEPTMSPEEEATAVPPEDVTTPEPFDAKIFEEIEAAEETESSRLKSAESLIALHSAFMPVEPMASFSPTTMAPSSIEEDLLSLNETLSENGTQSTLLPSTFTSGSTKVLLTSTTSILTTIEDITANSDNDTETTSVPRRFLNSHVQLRQHDIVIEDMDPEETCRQSSPCENGGTCVVKNKQVQCECASEYTGVNCAEVDMCLNHACAQNSTCKNGPKGTYICECKENTVGTYCEFTCPENYCLGKGLCVMRKDGKIGCTCNPGFTGRRCEKEIDECQMNYCQNAVRCIDKFNDYECICEEGWIGKDCDRPCQDVYGSCKIWKREGQCEISEESTQFFLLNCPATCGICEPKNETSVELVDRLPAILLPLSWIIGVWETQVKGFNGRAFDYPLDFNSSGYNETLTFSVAKPIMFGTPSINYTSKAVNIDDPEDVHLQNGFLTIRQYAPEGERMKKVALSSVNNQGVTIIEEGPLSRKLGTSGPILNLFPVFTNIQTELQRMIPRKINRSFARKGNRLVQTVTKETNGRKIKFKKVYDRIREYEFF